MFGGARWILPQLQSTVHDGVKHGNVQDAVTSVESQEESASPKTFHWHARPSRADSSRMVLSLAAVAYSQIDKPVKVQRWFVRPGSRAGTTRYGPKTPGVCNVHMH